MFVAISIDPDPLHPESTVNSVFGPFSDEEKARAWICDYRINVEGDIPGVTFDPENMEADWSIQEVTYVDEDGDLAADMADEGGPAAEKVEVTSSDLYAFLSTGSPEPFGQDVDPSSGETHDEAAEIAAEQGLNDAEQDAYWERIHSVDR